MTAGLRRPFAVARRLLSGYSVIWRLPACRNFLGAQFVSLLGTSAFRVAIAWYSVDALHSATALGWALTAATVPQIVVGPVAGVLGDRLGRKRAVVYSDLLAGVAFILMFVLAERDTLGLPQIVALSAITGVANAVFVPNASALVPVISDGANVSEANAARMVTAQLASILGPAAAALLIGLSGAPLVFLINGLSFLVSALIFGLTRLTAGPYEGARRGGDRRGMASVRILRDRVVRAGIVLGALANFFVVASVAVLVPTLIAAAGHGAAWLGAFTAAQAGGFVAGGIAAPLLTRDGRADVRIAFGGMAVAAILLYPIVNALSNIYALGLVGLLVGSSLAIFEVHWESYLLQRVEPELLGRACAVDAWTSFTGRTAGLLAAGWVVSPLGAGGALRWATGVFLGSALLVGASTLRRTGPKDLSLRTPRSGGSGASEWQKHGANESTGSAEGERVV